MDYREHEIGYAPPEVLDMVFGFLELEDLKSCRLVSKHWKSALRPQLDQRVHLDLSKSERRAGASSRRRTEAAINAEPGEFKNLTLSRQVPGAIEDQYKSTLTSLYLKSICFDSIDEVRRILFSTFESMKEVGLDGVCLLRDLEITPPKKTGLVPAPKVRKLKIKRAQNVMRKDLIGVWGFFEILQNFAQTLKEVDVEQKTSVHEQKRLFFPILQEQGICLTHLVFSPMIDEEDITSFKDYFQQCGRSLRVLSITSTTENLFSRWFNDLTALEANSFEQLKIGGQDWSQWFAHELLNLKVLHMSQANWSSFDFLVTMPHLRCVEMRQNEELCDTGPNVATEVHQLTLKGYKGHSMAPFSRLFPNVERLILKDAVNIAISRPYILESIAQAWPNLVQLEISGEWYKYLSQMLPLTLDDMEMIGCKKAKGVGNEKMQEYRHLLTMTNLTSFTHNDEESLKVGYGDECGREVFLKMPNLRFLHIGRCLMSTEMIQQLHAKLAAFTFKIQS